MYGVSAPFKQVSPRKVRRIVTNGVRSLQKCTLDQRSEVVGDPVGFRVRARGMDAEGKLGGGGWWINLPGLPVVRARVCASSRWLLIIIESRSGC